VSSSDLKTRIEAALKRRDDLHAQKERALGRLEEAEKNLEAIRVELRAKNVDPDHLDDTILKLEKALLASLSDFESQLSEAEKSIKPFAQ